MSREITNFVVDLEKIKIEGFKPWTGVVTKLTDGGMHIVSFGTDNPTNRIMGFLIPIDENGKLLKEEKHPVSMTGEESHWDREKLQKATIAFIEETFWQPEIISTSW